MKKHGLLIGLLTLAAVALMSAPPIDNLVPTTQTVMTNSTELNSTAPVNVASTNIIASTCMTVGAVLTAMDIGPASADAGTLPSAFCALIAEFGTKYLWLCAVANWLEGYNPGD